MYNKYGQHISFIVKQPFTMKETPGAILAARHT